MYLGNHPREFHYSRLGDRFDAAAEGKMFNSNILYRNNGDETFTNVTKIANLINFGFALGIVASDINMDGWIDIYVSNDYDEPDNMYINQGDGSFKDMSLDALAHMSNFGMGADIADFNNDGLLDIIVVDMMAEDNFRQKTNMSAMAPENFWYLADNGWHYQYMRNSLQLNRGNGRFSEVGQLAGINNTDWSWAALFADFNNNGSKDLFISNGYRRDSRNNDFRKEFEALHAESKRTGEAISYYDYLDLMPEHKLVNYYYENNGDLTFSNKAFEYGLNTPSFSNGAAYGDLDNDGDLELVVNNMVDPAFIYDNNSVQELDNNYLRLKLNGHDKNLNGLGTKVTLEVGTEIMYQELTLTRGYQSSVEPILHFGLGEQQQADKLTIVWPDGKREVLTNVAANQVLTLDYVNAKDIQANDATEKNLLFTDITKRSGADFIHRENEYDDYAIEILLPHKMSQFGPAIAVGDVNGDGLDDFFVGGAQWQEGVMYMQRSNEKFELGKSQPWSVHKGYEDVGAEFFDFDSDGDLDLYVVSGGNEFAENSPMLQDRIYVNDGKGNFSKRSGVLPIMHTSGACVAPYDFDDDGDIDLFVGGRLVPSKYPFPARSYLLRNDGGKFTDITAEIAPDLVQPGMVTSAVWSDFDGDGKQDLIIVGEWMSIGFYKNEGTSFTSISKNIGMDEMTGWWFDIVAADFDGDGDDDYVVGNLGNNYKYRTSDEEPFPVYCYDFDKNGTLDIVLGFYSEGICYPLRGRECSSDQMPFIKDKFETYESFGKATIYDVYENDLGKALHYEIKTFATSYIENKGNGKFELTSLPHWAQFSTVNGILAQDFDNDQKLDLVLAGNLFVSEVETGRADASIGLFMKGDGTGKFNPVPAYKSGFYTPKDVKDIKLINYKPGMQPIILVANNNDQIQLIRVNMNVPSEGQDQIAQSVLR